MKIAKEKCNQNHSSMTRKTFMTPCDIFENICCPNLSLDPDKSFGLRHCVVGTAKKTCSTWCQARTMEALERKLSCQILRDEHFRWQQRPGKLMWLEIVMIGRETWLAAVFRLKIQRCRCRTSHFHSCQSSLLTLQSSLEPNLIAQPPLKAEEIALLIYWQQIVNFNCIHATAG